jgi:hypothetical protein
MLRWNGAGYVVRMDDERMVKRVFLGNPGGRRQPGRPRLRWLDCVEDDLKTLGVRGWRKKAVDREDIRRQWLNCKNCMSNKKNGDRRNALSE